MKFYYSTATSSTIVHIALAEAGLPFTPVEISWQRNLNVDLLDKVNPLGAVPVLEIEPGKVITQNAAILAYIGELKPSLYAPAGSFERAKINQWLAFAASDFQKAAVQIFISDQITSNESAQKDIDHFYTENVKSLLSYIDQSLQGKQFIASDHFTVADAYLFSVINACKFVNIGYSELENLSAYMGRLFERPAIQKVLKEEGFLD